MHKTYIFLTSCAFIAACAEVSNERTSSIVVDGETYTVVTDTVTEGNRTFDVSRVRVDNRELMCDLALSGDCESIVREELENPGGPA